MFKRKLIVVLVLLLAGCVGYSWQPAVAPITPPLADSFPAPLVAQGAQLAAAGNCASCHTIEGGPVYGGGLGMETGFGLVYSSNISPDPQTGIGTWSEAAFARAMREGVRRDGAHLLPAFPYTHFAKLSDADITALYAFMMTQPAVTAARHENTIKFPFNIRGLLVGWNLLFFERGVYRSDASKSDEWNRGAYLAEGIAHCAACHTPRNRLGAERSSMPYAGAMMGGWRAPALNAQNPAPLPWTQQDLYDYLRRGESELHGAAAGAMAVVVHRGLVKLPDADIQAIASYFADSNGSAARAPAAAAALAIAMSRRLADMGQESEPGANLYLAACAYCHYSGAPQAGAVQGSLALSTALSAAEPDNFIQTVLQGLGGASRGGRAFMPGFAGALSDADIALLAAYLRRTRTDLPAWPDLPASVTAIASASRKPIPTPP